MTRSLPTIVLALLLAACNGENISLAVSTPVVSPSNQPAIFSPTPPFIPTTTLTKTFTPVSTTLSETITYTLTDSLTSTSTLTSTLTMVPTLPSDLGLDILGCNTSLDILHQMGEVTNAYPIVRNYSGKNLTNVCATLSASDEARVHPGKTACVVELPAGDQVTLKLTVDTGLGQDTAIKVVITTNEGLGTIASRSSCRDIGLPGWLPDKVGVIEQMP